MIRMDTAPAARGVWKKLGGRLATPLLWGAATLILCGAQAFGRPLPLAAGAILLAGASPGGLFAAAGAIGGYLLLWGWEAAMEPLALSLSFLAAAVIFRKTPISLQYLSAGLTGVVGAVFLLDSGFSPVAVLHLLLSAGLAYALPLVWNRGKPELRSAVCSLILLACLSLAVPPWGASLAAGVSLVPVCAGAGLPAAVLCGAAVDASGVLPVPMTGVLALGELAARALAPVRGWKRSGVFFAATAAWQLVTGGLSPLLCLSAALGAAAGAFFPISLPAALNAEEAPIRAALPRRETGVEHAFETMGRVLSREQPVLSALQLNEVYDYAAEQVCRCCVRWSLCWEEDSEATYRDLCRAGEAILLRGTALRDDLPDRFTARCHHTEGFLTAVNQELDAQRAKLREERRFEEGRQIAAAQYQIMARLLKRAAEPGTTEPLRFIPELAVGTATRAGNPVSGDRGATCRDRFGRFYVLLCDGMGTGPEARAESDLAAHLLASLLEAGVNADSAMDLLNGFYLLRKTTAFATMDLLRLDLRSGKGELYKWGAAPSYLQREGGVEKIGTAAPPPGCGIGPSHRPGRCELSLRDGETLVMVSDGAYGEETERLLAGFSQGTVRDLASCLITLGEADAADDRTAVVLRLRSA